jgi:hypothetical protein
VSKAKSGGKAAEQLSLEKIKAALKQVLRQRGLTYKDVAEYWNCSEPTVKRLLGPEELPLSRLLVLLERLSLSLMELHKLTELESLAEPRWTAKQYEFLAKNPKLFGLLMKLYESGATPQTVARKYKISPEDLERMLIQLEKYDIIRVGTKGDVKPFYPRPPRLEGRLGAMHTNRVVDRMSHYFKFRISDSLAKRAKGLTADNGALTFMVHEMTEKTYLEYREKLERLFKDMESAANIEQNIHPKSELKSCVSQMAFFLDRAKSPELATLEDMFAEDLLAKDEQGSV